MACMYILFILEPRGCGSLRELNVVVAGSILYQLTRIYNLAMVFHLEGGALGYPPPQQVIETLFMCRYELPQPGTAQKNDVAAWQESVDNSLAQLEHQAGR